MALVNEDVRLPQIRLNDRIAIFGATGTGKSVLAHALYQSVPENWWKIIIDVTDSIVEPSALTFYDPDEIPWDKSYSLRYVPDAGAPMDIQISTLFLNIYYHGACWYWLDEANEVSDAHKTAFGLRKVLLQGRKAYVGGACLSPRPKDISKSIITQSQYIAIFTIIDYDDRSTIAKNIGMTPAEFDDQMNQLEEHGFLFFDVRSRTLYRVPPIPREIVEKLENPPIEEIVET